MLYRTISLFLAASLPSTAIAQSFPNGGHPWDQEQRASVGVVIPFGGARDAAERKPRIELQLDQGQRRIGAEQSPRNRQDGARPTVRFGFTITEEPQVMLNGRAVPRAGDRNNFSATDGLLVGLGVLAAGALGWYIVLVSQGPHD